MTGRHVQKYRYYDQETGVERIAWDVMQQSPDSALGSWDEFYLVGRYSDEEAAREHARTGRRPYGYFFGDGVAELVTSQILAVLSQSYRPIYGEKKCRHCGYLRGQHVPVQIRKVEDYSDDRKMRCPNSSILFFEKDKSNADVG